MLHDYELDMLGCIGDNSKSSLLHNYLELYGAFFRPFKNNQINILELGVQEGYSIELWLEYFPKATIVGVDWTSGAASLARDRVIIKIGRQDDAEFLDKITAEFPPTIVIDDCSHLAYQTMASLEILFKVVVPGGLYVIEDLLFQRPDIAEFYKGEPNAQNPIEFLKRHSAYLMGSYYVANGASDFDRYFHEHVDFITSISSAAVLGKKPLPDVPNSDLFTLGEEVAARKGTALAWSRLAAFIRRHNGGATRVETAAREAIARDRHLPLPYLELAELYASQRRFEDAVNIMRDISSLRPDAFEVWRALGLYRMHAAQLDEAEENLRTAIRLNNRDFWTMKHLSDVLERAGRPDAAIDAARIALELGIKENPAYLSQHLDRLEKTYRQTIGSPSSIETQ